MSYHFTKTVAMPFDDAVEHVTKALAGKGFGVLTTINVRETMKKKLGVDFKPYTILGACNPHYAYKALQAEDKIGTMLPCNVIVQDVGNGQVEVAAIDPAASMERVGKPELTDLAHTVRTKLQAVLASL